MVIFLQSLIKALPTRPLELGSSNFARMIKEKPNLHLRTKLNINKPKETKTINKNNLRSSRTDKNKKRTKNAKNNQGDNEE